MFSKRRAWWWLARVLAIFGLWRFFFYSNDGSEPVHVHVESAGGTAKLWLTPVALAGSARLKPSELREAERPVRLNRKLLLEAWDDSSAVDIVPCATSVECTEDELRVVLTDGRTLSVPLGVPGRRPVRARAVVG
jgi:hypothetical protein